MFDIEGRVVDIETSEALLNPIQRTQLLNRRSQAYVYPDPLKGAPQAQRE